MPVVKNRPSKHTHRLVYTTAVELAGAAYEELMKNNEWYKIWLAGTPDLSPRRRELLFIRRFVPKMLPQARAMLAATLASPIPDQLKEVTYDALLLDSTLIRGRSTS
jgi:hypothetical protein